MSVLTPDSGTMLAYEPTREVDLLEVKTDEIEQFRATSSQRIVPVGSNFTRQVVIDSIPLILSDLLAIFCASLWGQFSVSVLGFAPLSTGALFPVLAVSMLLILGFLELYPGSGQHRVLETKQLLLGTTLSMLLASVFLASYSAETNSLATIFSTWLTALFLIPTFRSIVRANCSKLKWWGQPALILGRGKSAERLYHSLKKDKRQGIKPVGLVHDSNINFLSENQADLYAGPPSEIVEIARQHSAYWLFVLQSELSSNPLKQEYEIESFAGAFPNVVVIPDNLRIPSLWNRSHDCSGTPGINIQERLMLPIPRFIKRTLDIVCTVVGSILISPLLIGIAVLIKLSSPGPVLYSSKRVGRNGKEIYPLKFRSMVQNADEVLEQYLEDNPEYRDEWTQVRKLKKDPRITKIGQFLRITSLDELPQLWNILMGDMSLVGPRPIFEDEIVRYREEFRLYTEVSPGLTGLWQISGRNNTTYSERVEYDRYYVRNWSLWLDLHILMRTLKVVLLREGAY